MFDYALGNVTYLSRADGFANYDEATAAPTSYSMLDETKAVYLNNDTQLGFFGNKIFNSEEPFPILPR